MLQVCMERLRILGMPGEVEVIAGFQYELNDVSNDGYLDFTSSLNTLLTAMCG